MTTKRIKFKNFSNQFLAGLLDTPQTRPKAYVLTAHCFTCGKNLKSINNISKTLAARGWGVLRFDFTGLGESEGDFADTNFSTNIEDLHAAAEYLRKNHQAPQLLLGHSLGGAAVLAAARGIPEAKAAATIATAFDTSLLSDILTQEFDDPSRKEIELVLAGRGYTIRRQLLLDLQQHNFESYIKELNLPLLLFHSPVDTIVPIENAKKIYQAANHPKSYVSLDQADHLLLDPADAKMVAEILDGWASRYIHSVATKPSESLS